MFFLLIYVRHGCQSGTLFYKKYKHCNETLSLWSTFIFFYFSFFYYGASQFIIEGLLPIKIEREDRFLYFLLCDHVIEHWSNAINWDRVVTHTQDTIKSRRYKCNSWLLGGLCKGLSGHSNVPNLGKIDIVLILGPSIFSLLQSEKESIFSTWNLSWHLSSRPLHAHCITLLFKHNHTVVNIWLQGHYTYWTVGPLSCYMYRQDMGSSST